MIEILCSVVQVGKVKWRMKLLDSTIQKSEFIFSSLLILRLFILIDVTTIYILFSFGTMSMDAFSSVRKVLCAILLYDRCM